MKIFLSLLLSVLLPSLALPQMTVVAPATDAQLAVQQQSLLQQIGHLITGNTDRKVATAEKAAQHGENIQKWVDSIEKLKTQIDKAQEVINLAQEMKEVVGDPTKVLGLLDSELLGGEGGAGLGDLAKAPSKNNLIQK